MIQDKITEIKQFLKSKGFKDKSIKTYSSIINKVINRIGEQFTEEELEILFTKFNLKPRTYNLYRTIMNFYTKKYLDYELTFTKAKVDKSLPNYVTYKEFNEIIKVTPNIKHKLGLTLMYGSGLRVYEVCRVKKHNIDFNKFVLMIREGKGGKDRQTIIPKSIINYLELFVKSSDKNNQYLFQTYNGHISERSFQEILKRAVRKAQLTKKITCHDLRHSFAINLLNKKVDIEEVRKMLGHSSLRTTQIYLQCKTMDLTKIAMIC